MGDLSNILCRYHDSGFTYHDSGFDYVRVSPTDETFTPGWALNMKNDCDDFNSSKGGFKRYSNKDEKENKSTATATTTTTTHTHTHSV